MTTAHGGASLTIVQSPAAGTPFGNNDGDQQVVSFTVTDGAGNSVSCQATITLYGDEQPTILLRARGTSLQMTIAKALSPDLDLTRLTLWITARR